ncbi:MAG: YihY family inner membrane protein [Gammaproteobacteria bacterium]|nr:YihY family inner membrane protein [Gammaproteobacteria bacterium]
MTKKHLNNQNKIIPFIIFVYNKFMQDDCMYRASALTFTTLLTIVPLMYVSLAILSLFPLSHEFASAIQNFIFQNFVPATGKVVQLYLQQFASQTQTLPTWDLLFLFVTVFFMMFTVEQSFNIIWCAPRARPNLHALLLYFSILCVSPILLGMSLTATTYFLSLPIFQIANEPLLLTKGLPFVFSLLGFTLLYAILPNCPVRFVAALVGGGAAAVSFEIAKHGFVFYLSQFNSYQQLYGAFAVIPVFFIWLYMVWLITLLGAEYVILSVAKDLNLTKI